MIISGSQIHLQGSHRLFEYHQQRESLSLWREGPQGARSIAMENRRDQLSIRIEGEQHSLRQTPGLNPRLPVDESLPQRMRNLLPAEPAEINRPPARISDTMEEEDDGHTLDLKTAMLKLFIEKLTGRELKLFDPRELEHHESGEIAELRRNGTNIPATGMRYEFEQILIERESTRFHAEGVVQTADGREIRFELQLNMDRSYLEHNRVLVETGSRQLKDPLVINFDGTAAQLTQTRYAFDLDANGQLNEIPFVDAGSGFLALDRNGDGKLNDGSELFGALSGQGFTELAAYDDDNNGWIDANDAVFSRLLIWSKDTQGNDQLETLAERGIGAIYLEHAATAFSLKDEQNRLQGQIRSSGIYLSEQGRVGSVQQLDLVV